MRHQSFWKCQTKSELSPAGCIRLQEKSSCRNFRHGSRRGTLSSCLKFVTNSVRLLDGYVRLWKYRHNPKILFQASGFQRPVQALLKFRDITERRALDSKVCLVALEIIREYETYLWHRQAVRRHVKVQRRIQSRNRAKLFDALALRDGKSCAYCKSRRRLLIDHVRPLVHGGLTEMSNLQLLCFSCNSKKSDKFREEKQ